MTWLGDIRSDSKSYIMKKTGHAGSLGLEGAGADQRGTGWTRGWWPLFHLWGRLSFGNYSLDTGIVSNGHLFGTRCDGYFSIAVIKPKNQGHLQEREFIWAYGSRAVRPHSAWQAAGLAGGAGS